VGLDGSTEFVAMARSYSECEVLQQDFLAMKLPENRFDGIFANASLFHVPSQELPRVLAELSETLRSRGVLFCSNPRGNNEEGLSGDRYGCFLDHDTWRDYVTAAGFFQVRHYYPPAGVAAPQAVVARDRLAQRIRCVTHRGQAGPAAPCRMWVSGEWFAQAGLAIRASLTSGANGRSSGRESAPKDKLEQIRLLIAWWARPDQPSRTRPTLPRRDIDCDGSG